MIEGEISHDCKKPREKWTPFEGEGADSPPCTEECLTRHVVRVAVETKTAAQIANRYRCILMVEFVKCPLVSGGATLQEFALDTLRLRGGRLLVPGFNVAGRSKTLSTAVNATHRSLHSACKRDPHHP